MITPDSPGVIARVIARSNPVCTHLYRPNIDPAHWNAVQLVLQDWRQTQRNLADTEARMTAILDELRLTVITTGRRWDPITATHGTNHHPMRIAA